jgi:putative endonuclease
MTGTFFVYILSSGKLGTLYVGQSNSLHRRVFEHKAKAVPGFTATYGVNRLVWFEQHETLESAMLREKRLKRWHRAWKVQLIEETNLDRSLADPGALSPIPVFPEAAQQLSGTHGPGSTEGRPLSEPIRSMGPGSPPG